VTKRMDMGGGLYEMTSWTIRRNNPSNVDFRQRVDKPR